MRSEAFGQPTSSNQGYSTGQERSCAILKTLRLHCVPDNCSRINSYGGILIWSYPSAGDKSAILRIILIYLIIYDLRKYHLCKMTSENHQTTPLINLFVKLKVIWVKLCIL